MSDILERLRDPKADWVMSAKAKELLSDCETEIEKLRAALWLITEDANSLYDAVMIARAALGETEA